MAAATPLFPVHTPSSSEEQRVLLSNVPWSTYVVLRDSLRAFRAELAGEV
jgi:hypothetical protein